MADKAKSAAGDDPAAGNHRSAGTQAPASNGHSPDYSEAESGDGGEPGQVGAFVIDAEAGAGERLDRFLAAQLPQFSRSRLQRWIALGAVYSEDRALAAKTRLSGAERIVVEPQPLEADSSFRPEPVALAVVDEDPRLIVLDKPAGLVVHPAAGNWSGTLMNGLLHRWPGLAALPRAGIVHRLDKETSGLMVVARDEATRTALIAQLADRSMARRYLALVAGAAPETGEVDAPIGRDPGNRLRMAVVEPGRGRPARTGFRALAGGTLGERRVTLLECRLHSGRTHQIRVHLSSIGYSLIGDSLYGGPRLAGFERQALHAWRLGLADPDTGAPRRWQVPPPPEMRELIARAGIDLETVLARLPWGETG